jgi:hypothetical protein
MSKTKYNNTFQLVTEATNIVANCAEISFLNQGTSVARINTVVQLQPEGGNIAFDGKKDEEDTSLYTITFDTGGNNNLVVLRKYYNS